VVLVEDPSPWEARAERRMGRVIAKRRGSIYEHRRSKEWLKMKCELSRRSFLGRRFTDRHWQSSRARRAYLSVYTKMKTSLRRRIALGIDTGSGCLEPARAARQSRNRKGSHLRKQVCLRVFAHIGEPEIVVRLVFIEWTWSTVSCAIRVYSPSLNDHAS
jgi:ATP-dependent DNA ligase